MPFDAVELEDWQKTLLKAAEIVRERGLRQGAYGFDGGPVCAVGAMFAADTTGASVLAARDALSKHLGVQHPMFWNDKPGRTAEEVAAVMETVAFGGK